MASKITIKRSLTAAAPAGLSFGEMAFVQGSGLTANQLYVGISGGSPAWVGAQIGTTGTWTDTSAQTSLATQYAIEQRISAKISAQTAGVSSFNGVTGAVTGVSSFNGLTGAVSGVTTSVANTFTAVNTFSAGITVSGNLNAVNINTTGSVSINNTPATLTTTTAGNATVFNSVATSLGIGGAATAITMGAATGTLNLRNPIIQVGNTVATINTASGTGNTLTISPYGSFIVSPTSTSIIGGTRPSLIVTNSDAAAGTVSISGGDLYLGVKTDDSPTTTPVNIVFEGATDNGFETTLTVTDPATADRTITLPDASGTVALTQTSVASFNGATGAVTGVSSFNGLTGAVSGLTSGGPLGTPASGTLTNCTFPTLNQNTTGSAATLTTSRNINGTAFNGSADITVTAAAGTLTGVTLNSTVLASSLTSVGTLGSLSITGDLTVGGTFTVNGTVTTINSTTLTVDDKNIELGSVASPTNATADGGGISLLGATTKSIIWDTTNDNWTSSENWNIPTGKVFKINNASVLSSTTLGSAVVTSSLTTVGTITSGTWSGSFGAVSGANLTTLTAGNLSGTIPSGVLANSTVYIGTTAVALNRTTASLALTGISSIDGSAATVTTAAQPNITSVGTLTSLTVSGTLEAGLIDGGTF